MFYSNGCGLQFAQRTLTLEMHWVTWIGDPNYWKRGVDRCSKKM